MLKVSQSQSNPETQDLRIVRKTLFLLDGLFSDRQVLFQFDSVRHVFDGFGDIDRRKE